MLLPHLKDLSTRVRGLGLMGNIGALLMHITAPLGFPTIFEYQTLEALCNCSGPDVTDFSLRLETRKSPLFSDHLYDVIRSSQNSPSRLRSVVRN